MKKRVVIFAAIVFLFSTVSAFEGGEGSANSPYQIGNCTQLQNISNDLTAHYELASDIDCSVTESWNQGNGFKPLGDDNNEFTGSLNGLNHYILDLKIDRLSENSGERGLFGKIGSTGTVENLGLLNVNVTGRGSVGGLSGRNNGTISETFVTGRVLAEGVNTAVGGLTAYNRGSISNSFSTATVLGNNRGYRAGFVGGQLDGGSITNSYSTGYVEGDDGGFVGASLGETSDSYWDTQTSNSSLTRAGTGLTTSEMQGSSASSNMAFDFSNTWNTTFSYPKLAWMDAKGDGSWDNEYQIYDCHDLQAIYGSAYYGVQNPIDCSQTKYWNNGKGFDPIGEEYAEFEGYFDGNDYEIRDLHIDRPSGDDVGLFGYTYVSDIVDANMLDVDIKGDSGTGALAGYHYYSDIYGCRVNGTVEGSGYTGMVVGNDDNGYISACYSDGEVVSSSWHAGGLVGQLDGSDAYDVYSHANVDAGSNDYVGGLFGRANYGSFIQAYSTGKVTGGSDTGGLVGGKLDLDEDAGYWDEDTSGQSFSAAGTGLSTSEMQGASACSNMDFDFLYTWSSLNNDYPVLKKFSSASNVCNDIPDEPTLIEPSDGENGLVTDPKLAVGVSDPDGDNMNVTFLRNLESQPQLGKENNVPDGGNAEIIWNDLNRSTTYEWYVTADDGNSTEDSKLWSFTTIRYPQVRLHNPVNGSTNNHVDSELKAEIRQQDGKEMNIFFELRNKSDGSFIDSASFTDTSSSWKNYTADFDLESGSEYEWDVNVTLTDTKYSVYNFSGISDFSTVEQPEVVSLEPANDSQTNNNPTLNVTVQGSAPINVTLNDYEKVSNPEFYSEKVNPGETVSFDLNNYGMGEDSTERWWVGLNSSGVLWNNSDDPYEFSTSEVSEVNYQVQNFDSGDNLNPGIYGGLDDVVGQKEVIFEVSNPEGKDMDIEFNVSNSTASEKFGQVNGVSSGDKVTVDITEASMVEENKAVYELNAFYREGQSIYDQDSFTSNNLDFSTYVTELSWTDESPQRTDEFRIYYNESDVGFNLFSEVGVTDAGNTNVGVANENLSSDNSVDCYAVRAWSAAGGLSDFAEPVVSGNPGSNCLGDTQP